MRELWNLAEMATVQGLWPLHHGQFGSKIKIAKNNSTNKLKLFYAKIGSQKG